MLKIVCIGWGSLIWNHGDLEIKGNWNPDGPFLPVEFARTSQDGRLTLVLVEGKDLVQTFWVEIGCTDIETAIDLLRGRENIGLKSVEKFIGVLRKNDNPDNTIKAAIKEWLISTKFDAVIWTNLPPRFEDENNRIPTQEEAIRYLQNLNKDKLNKAIEYIINAPKQIETPYRKAFRKRLGIIE